MSSGQDLAALMRKIREAEENTPEREEYLEKLAVQIREGTYQIDTEELARKLLQEFDDVL